MPFTSAPPLSKPAPTGSGVSFSLRISKRNSAAWIIFNQEAQQRIFGRPVIGEGANVAVGRGTDEGRLQVTVGEGPFKFEKGMRGVAVLKVGAWDLLPKDKRPAQSLEVQSINGPAVVLKLPSYCRPSAHDGKLAREFGQGISAKKGA